MSDVCLFFTMLLFPAIVFSFSLFISFSPRLSFFPFHFLSSSIFFLPSGVSISKHRISSYTRCKEARVLRIGGRKAGRGSVMQIGFRNKALFLLPLTDLWAAGLGGGGSGGGGGGGGDGVGWGWGWRWWRRWWW